MSNERTASCTGCQKDMHCYSTLVDCEYGCACSCPPEPSCHFVTPHNMDGLCGAKLHDAQRKFVMFRTTNMWTHVTCPDCLALPPAQPCHLSTPRPGPDAFCGATYIRPDRFASTHDWNSVTCPDCLLLRPPFDRDHA